MEQNSGFTLIEVIVTIGIISVLSYLLSSGYPALRDREALRGAEQYIQTVVREAQSQALQEERHPDCLARFAADDTAGQRTCSDIGVAFEDTQVYVFADINQDGEYDTSDFLQSTQTLPSGVTVGESSPTLVFRAAPPHVNLFVNGVAVGESAGTIELRVNSQTHRIEVFQYGRVEGGNILIP